MNDNNYNQMNNNIGQPQVQPMNNFNQPVQPTPQPMPAEPVQQVQPQPMPVQPVEIVQPQPMGVQPAQSVQQQPMGVQPAQPVQPQPMNNTYQPPVNNSVPPVVKSNSNNSGLLIGGIFLILIIGAVLLIVLKPFDKTYSGPSNNGSSDSGTSNSGTSNNGSSSNSGSYSTSSSKSTCTLTQTTQGVKTLINVDVSSDGTNGTKLNIGYTMSKTSGQAFTSSEKEAITKNMETSLRNSYSSIGTVSNVSSSLSNGKLNLSVTVRITGNSSSEYVAEFRNQGYTCN